MKLPFPKDDHNKRMTSTPDAPVSRELLYELRETSLIGHGTVNGNANGTLNGTNGAVPRLMIDKAVQFEADMDLNDMGDYNGGASVNSYPPPTRDVETSITAEWSPTGLNETIPVHAKVESTDETIKAWRRDLADVSSSSEAQQKPPQQQQNPTTDDGPRYKINNESNTNSPDDPSGTNTSTWRIRDRDRHSSSSEDEIEKISESVLDIGGGGEAAKPWRTGENREENAVRTRSPKAGDPGSDPDEEGDCLIQCLSYTLQCCECVIS